MPALNTLDWAQWAILLLLILTRVSGFMLSTPPFQQRGIPQTAKFATALALSLIFLSIQWQQGKALGMVHDLPQLVILAAQELLLGLAMGFGVQLLFSAIQGAGELTSNQMGLSVASTLNPVLQTQSPVVGQFYFLLAMVVFFGLDIHHLLLAGLGKSFEWLPSGQVISASPKLFGQFSHLCSEVMTTSLLLAMPVFGLLFVFEVGLGFVAKAMPQMNIFMVGIPIKIVLGLAFTLTSLPLFSQHLGEQYRYVASTVFHLVHLLGGH